MRAGWRGVLAAAWALALCWLPAGPAQAQPVLRLSALEPRVSLGPQLESLEDSGRQLDWDTIADAQPVRWQRHAAEVLNYSFSTSAWWLRFSVRNDTPRWEKRLVEAAMPLQDEIAWRVTLNGRPQPIIRTGDRHPFATRSVSYRNPVFVLDLAPGDQADVLIRLDTHDGLYEAIPLLLWKEADFFSNTSVETLIFGCYYGGILALLLYNLLLFLSTRERLFALYAAYLASFLLWNFSFRGYAFLFFWPDAPAFGNQIIGLSGVAIFVTLSTFSCTYLQTRTRTPRLHKLIVTLATLVGLHAIPAALDHYAATFRTLMPLGALLLFTLLCTAVYLMFRGYRSARFYALAWVFVIAGAIAYTLRVFDVLPANFLTEFSLNIGSALEFILLAFVLADRINVLKEEKLTLERHALAAQRARSAELEQRVNERTRELAAANAKLQELAVTDSLTGLHNRRYFNEALAQELDRTAREQVELGLIAIDVDHFKRLNDRLGHQAGDQALVEVARIIRGALKRPTDFAFRLGGEEFGVLVCGTTPAGLRQVAEAIVDGIAAARLPHPDHPLGHMTVSAGVALTDARARTAEALYARADQALYRAKAAGRNRVC